MLVAAFPFIFYRYGAM